MTFTFGPFSLIPGQRELLKNGAAIKLPPKAFDVLVLLVEKRPKLVTKKELIAHVWQLEFVDDASITNVISHVRKALGDTPEAETYIRTVQRHGYAFKAPVTEHKTEQTKTTRFWLTRDGERFPLRNGETTVGRDPSSHIWFESLKVTWRHARVTVEGDTASIEDLGSTNGTYVGGKRINNRTTLRDGHVITVGDITLSFRGSPAKRAKTNTMSSPPEGRQTS